MTEMPIRPTQHLDICPHQFAFILDNPIRKVLQHPRKIIGDYIGEGGTVLDLGCGPGYFSIEMAKLVGVSGRVIAADLQPEMLDKVRRKAIRHGVGERMEFHQCHSSKIGYGGKVDFILAYYMIHETGNAKAILDECRGILTPNGRLLIVEPKMHVSLTLFESMLREADDIGLAVAELPEKKGGRSVLFKLK